jgi:Fe-S-cluster containining protein
MYKSLRQFKKEMKTNLKEYTTFLKGLSRRKVKGLNSKVNRLHKDAYEKIDCGQCANCCKVMTPTYNKADIKRISKHVGMTPKEYWKKYLVIDENKDTVHKKTPCHFLDKNNRCTIYEIRPSDCRLFPHTQRTDFIYQREIHTQNLEYCPITYHIVEKLNEMVVVKKNTN